MAKLFDILSQIAREKKTESQIKEETVEERKEESTVVGEEAKHTSTVEGNPKITEEISQNPQAEKESKSLQKQIKALDTISKSNTKPEIKTQASIASVKLNLLYTEITTELAQGKAIPDSKLREIKQKRAEVESRSTETAPVVLLAKTIVNATDRLSQAEDGQVDEEKFERNLGTIVNKLAVEDTTISKDGKKVDIESLKTKLNQLSSGKISEERLEQISTDTRLGLVINALERKVITIEDIQEDLFIALSREGEDTEKNETNEDGETDENNLLLTEIIQSELHIMAERIESDEFSAVKQRLAMATPFIDLILSRVGNSQITEDHIDFIFAQFNLLKEQAEQRLEKSDPSINTTENTERNENKPLNPNIMKNYENAEITREAYKRIVIERNQQALKQQEVRLRGLEQDIELSQKLESFRGTLSLIESPAEKAQRIIEFISEQNKDKEANDALKIHLIEEIKQKVVESRNKRGESVDIPIEMTGEIDISLDEESGYHVLYFKNKDDFKNLTQSSGNEIGAAYKLGSVYLICDDGTFDRENEGIALEGNNDSNISTRKIPSLKSIAHHEIVHLEFDDTRKVHIERETIFTAQKILNLLTKEQQNLTPDDQTQLLERITTSLKTQNGELFADIGDIKDQSIATKIRLLSEHHSKKIKELMAVENDSGRKYLQVEELSAEISDKMVATGGKLTLDAIGIGTKDTFSIWRETTLDNTESNNSIDRFNTHNIEAINMLRIINQAIPENYSEEERQELMDKWARRIMQFEEFNTTNTLSFIFDMVVHDGIDLSGKFQPKVDIAQTSDTNESKYLQLASRYVNGSFKYNHVLEQFSQGKLQGKTPEEIEVLITSIFTIYSSVVAQGLEDTTDIKSIQDRAVENDLFKFASRAFYDQVIGLHKREGRVGHPYSAAWPGGINYILEGLGLKVKDVAEKGWLAKWGTDPATGKRTLLTGYDASLMPVKPWNSLPFGLGENSTWVKRFQNLFKKVFGINLVNESITNSHYRQRTGESQLTMDIQDIHSSMVELISERLQKTKHYSDAMQIYNMFYDRIGIAHFEGGKMTIAHKGLTERRNRYLSRHLYAPTNRAGVLTGSRSVGVEFGYDLYEDLVQRGYSGLDLHLLMEAQNENQVMIDSAGTRTTFNAYTHPLPLGVITETTAERTKMMRFGGEAVSIDPAGMVDYIAQGKRFDDISKFIMELQLDSYYNQLSSGVTDIDKMRIYSMEDVIKAIEKIDNLGTGITGATDSVENWNKTKSEVTLEFGGKSKTFSRADLKEYVRCFYYGKTYEAMALGIYGEEQVVRLNDFDSTGLATGDIYFEIIEGHGIGSEEEKNFKVQSFIDQWNAISSDTIEKSYNKINPPPAPQYNTLSTIAQNAYILTYQQQFIDEFQKYGLIIKLKNLADIPRELHPSPGGGMSVAGEIALNELTSYRKRGKDIAIRLPGYQAPQIIKARDGLTKDEMNLEFGDFVQNDAGLGTADPDAFTLANIKPKLINAVEDVIETKDVVSAEYFYLRQLMAQAEDYTQKSSANKEKWLGIAKATMLFRWVHTGLTLAALLTFPPALAGLFLNPIALGLLLANYFLIGNWLTRTGELWGKRKTSGIQATNKLKELEPAFEKAFFDPKFSLGPEADRLYQLLKVAEDVLKGALVTSVDNPDNYLAELLKTTADTGKKMATP